MPLNLVDFIQGDAEKILSLLLLLLARLLPVISLVPFFGAKVLPIPAKIGLGLALALLLFPSLEITLAVPLGWNTLFILLLAKEILIGFLIGFLASVPFFIVQMSGIVIDNQRGSSSLTGQDLLTSSQSSMMGILFNYMTITIFFSIGGPFLFLDALVKSYHAVPVEQFLPSSFFTSLAFWNQIIGLMSKIFALSIQLAAPVLLTILMTNAFLGIANRLAPQIQISFLGQGLSAFCADLSLFLAWVFITDQMEVLSLDWIASLTHWITLLH